MKDIRIGIRLDATTHDICKRLAPEGNISMWIRSLIRKELQSMDITNVKAAELIYRSLVESGFKIAKSRILDGLDISRPDESVPIDIDRTLNFYTEECEADEAAEDHYCKMHDC